MAPIHDGGCGQVTIDRLEWMRMNERLAELEREIIRLRLREFPALIELVMEDVDAHLARDWEANYQNQNSEEPAMDEGANEDAIVNEGQASAGR